MRCRRSTQYPLRDVQAKGVRHEPVTRKPSDQHRTQNTLSNSGPGPFKRGGEPGCSQLTLIRWEWATHLVLSPAFLSCLRGTKSERHGYPNSHPVCLQSVCAEPPSWLARVLCSPATRPCWFTRPDVEPPGSLPRIQSCARGSGPCAGQIYSPCQSGTNSLHRQRETSDLGSFQIVVR